MSLSVTANRGTLWRAASRCTSVGRPAGLGWIERHNVGKYSQRRVRRTTAPRVQAALEQAVHQATELWDLAVGVGLPCTIQRCGDAIYRSTLDPKLRLEETNFFSSGGAVLLGIILAYLSITPRPGIGFIDYYILEKLNPRRPKQLSLDSFKITSKLGEGGFGSVYKAETVAGGPLPEQEVVLKRAEQFGLEEEWMNRRMMRAQPESAALFVQSFRDKRLPPAVASAPSARGFEFELPRMPWEKKENGVPTGEPLWLVWKLEGTQNLANVIASKEFPYDMEEPIFGRELSDMPRGAERKAVTIKALFNQILKGLDAMHGMGIVHRDVKCENLVLTNEDIPGKARLKFVDFGGAADLRIGLNYAPKEYLMDPRYAAPEQYIMTTQTPNPPPVPVALILSPILWQLNLPDRFDMFSAGLILLQMCLPGLRSDNALITFRRALDRNGQDVVLWREQAQKRASLKPEDQEGWDILDANDGVGWELVQSLLRPEAPLRASASQTRRHPFITGKTRITTRIDGAIRTLTDDAVVGKQSKWVLRRMARSGTQEVGGFTEAQMEKINALERVPTKKEAEFVLSRYVAQTIAKISPVRNGSGKANAANGNGNNGTAKIKVVRLNANGNGGKDKQEEELVEDLPRMRRPRYVAGTRAAVAQLDFVQKLNFWGRFGIQESLL